jgi:hypothetical protein
MNEWCMSDELERICKKAVWPNFEGLSDIRLEGLREATRNLSQDSRSPGRDLNSGPPKYEAYFPTTRPRRSILRYHVPFCYFLYVLHRLSCIQWIITCKYVRREPGYLSQYSVCLRAGRPGDRVSIPGRDKGFFLYPLCPDRLWGPRSLLYNGYRRSFPRE